MTLDGTRLGPYEITSTIGVGGMGEVYRAVDTRLGRNVAIKILHSRLTNDAAIRKRLQREARAVSSLNHPHISALYDIGSDDGRDYLVMEFLEGETLAQRLARGRLRVGEALEYAIQIASALDRAHRQGIVHRDLKPGNIMLTKTGAKLLDFGLAQFSSAESEASGPLTAEGALVGTIEYMAPEQLNGTPVDARSDLFSFGSVLYEMLTGSRAFSGQNRASLIGAILFATPEPVAQRHTDLPPSLQRVIDACLRKDPDDRVQTAHDLKRELEWIRDGALETHSRFGRRRWKGGYRAIALLLAAAAGAGAFVIVQRRLASETAGEVRFHVTPPTEGMQIEWPVLSPDAKRLAFIARSAEGTSSLWIRDLSSTEARLVRGSEGAAQPFWAPDSQSIGYFANDKLNVHSLSDLSGRPIANATASRGGSWSSDGTILYAPFITTPIYATTAIAVTPRAVTRLSAKDRDVSHRWPEFLPDGRRFLFVIHSRNLQRSGLYAGELGSDVVRKISNITSRTVVGPDGSLLFISERRLYRQPFDLRRAELRGPPVAIADDVNVDLKITGASAISVAAGGAYAWHSTGDERTTLTWFSRSGVRGGDLGPPRYHVNPSLSKDGTRVAVSIIDESTGRNSIAIIDVATGRTHPFIHEDANADAPVWTDSGSILYTSDRGGSYALYERDTAGPAADRTLSNAGRTAAAHSAVAAGVLFHVTGEDGRGALWFRDANGATTKVLEGNEGQTDLSPDGRWLLAVQRSEDTERRELFLIARTDPSRRLQVSNGGGNQPIWRPDGREFYYVDAERQLIAVPFESGRIGRAIKLFNVPVDTHYANHDVVPARDGERFLVNLPVTDRKQPLTTVVVKRR